MKPLNHSEVKIINTAFYIWSQTTKKGLSKPLVSEINANTGRILTKLKHNDFTFSESELSSIESVLDNYKDLSINTDQFDYLNIPETEKKHFIDLVDSAALKLGLHIVS